ncbi:DUF485 domain-containing protein [Streptomyces sp. NBC_01498]|uniref:DUF485 domain-containing protein n=1 Tax=Streptomyces sp. NBC_01498 TaxID=2975870 RepID=UPI002E7B966C|nr:DUF485 domain-containing protein [Streptomyces sp. NBC_01498]WTL24259.1 DUF485 domain-containing protein [Streptomyces sp. NBC_01498]
MDKQDGRDAATVRTDDPWYDALASGWGEPDGVGIARSPGAAVGSGTAGASVGPAGVGEHGAGPGAAEIYREIQRGAAFQEVRRRYRRFVVPATLAFLAWYLAYVVAATTAPGLMAHPVAGALNVAMVAGLAQFATTFLLTWAYSRHARLYRDRDALDLRWSVFDRTRNRDGDAARAEARR